MAVGEPGHHPQYVAVHRRLPPAKGRRGDGAGGVVPDARQGQQTLVGIREAAHLHHGLRRPLEIPGPAVIAQPLPQLHQAVLRRGGQSLHRGEGLQKAGVIAQHRRHPGLLEHDLRHPDAVRVLRAAPGQVPGILPEPDQKRLCQPLPCIFHCQFLFSHGIIIPHGEPGSHPSPEFFSKTLDLPPCRRYTIPSETR